MDLPNPVLKPVFCELPALQADPLPLRHWRSLFNSSKNCKSLCWTPGFPKESTHNAGDLGSIPEFGRSPRGACQPLEYSCLENPHGQRSLAGYSSWDHKESDMTEWLSNVIYLKLKITKLQISSKSVKKKKKKNNSIDQTEPSSAQRRSLLKSFQNRELPQPVCPRGRCQRLSSQAYDMEICANLKQIVLVWKLNDD